MKLQLSFSHLHCQVDVKQFQKAVSFLAFLFGSGMLECGEIFLRFPGSYLYNSVAGKNCTYLHRCAGVDFEDMNAVTSCEITWDSYQVMRRAICGMWWTCGQNLCPTWLLNKARRENRYSIREETIVEGGMLSLNLKKGSNTPPSWKSLPWMSQFK